VIYRIGDLLFAHVWGELAQETKYLVIEPTLKEDEFQKYKTVREAVLEKSIEEKPAESDEEFTDIIEDVLSKTVAIRKHPRNESGGLFSKLFNITGKIEVTKETYDKFRYRLNRDIVGLGPLEPMIRDKYFEDIHVITREITYGVHRVFDMVRTNIKWDNEEEYERYLKALGERIGKPITDAHPIIDAKLPDGSRLNLIYSDDVSYRGSSLTIRKFKDVPFPFTQLVKWGTWSAELAAYIWLCLENDMSFIISGETASGKTTTMNAALSFIDHDAKIYTVEDTPEVLPPHNAWQQMVTREAEEGRGGVNMFDLLKAALRSRPNYIIIGEVRGEEGRIAFQAMQTGHATAFTFHAGTIESLVQRITSDPINVPIPFVGALDFALFQNFIKGKGVRRVTSLQEIEGYSKKFNGIVSRETFEYDYTKDEIVFKGYANSYVLEEKIALKLGFADRKKIYEELELRTKIVDRMVQERIFDYHEVNEILKSFRLNGIDGLPFSIY
jgi:flagellar protein FlaI